MVCRLLLALFLLVAPAAAPAQDGERAAVLAAVDHFISAVTEGDAEEIAAAGLAEGAAHSLRYAPEGTVLRRRAFRDFAEKGADKRRYEERYWNPTVLIHRDIAIFWAPYALDIDGRRSHCGIDAFDLVKVDGRWKVAAAMWTVEPDNCPSAGEKG